MTDADATLASAYVWRGLTVVNRPVLQPSLELATSLGRVGVTGSVWSNIELGRYDGASDLSESGGTSAFNVAEIDPSLELSLPLGSHALAVGVDGFFYTNHAGLTSDDAAAEVYVKLALDWPGSPALGWWRDVTSIDGSYLEGSLQHSFALGETVSLDLWTNAGWSLSQGGGNFARDGFTHWEGSLGVSWAWRGVTFAPWVSIVFAHDPWTRFVSATERRDVKAWAALSISGALFGGE